MKAKSPSVLEDVVIEAAVKGLRIGPFAARLAREKPPSKTYTTNLKCTIDQTMTFAEGWKSKTKANNSKGTTGMHRRAIEAKANCRHSKGRTSKSLT